MKKIFCLIMVLSSIFCFGHEANEGTSWEDHWVKGIAYCTEEKFEAGIQEFSEAIRTLELASNFSVPQLYIDRAKANIFLGNYYTALDDLDISLKTTNLSVKEQIKITAARITVFSHLGMNQEALEEFNHLKNIDPDFPKIDNLEHYIIIHNVPKSKTYRKAIRCLLIHCDICESLKDIYIYPSDTLVAVKKCHCGCDCCEIRDAKEQFCDQCGMPLSFIENMCSHSNAETASCQQCCDDFTAFALSCITEKPSRLSYQLGGFYAIDFVRQLCQTTPQDENFFIRCLRPFAEMVSPSEPFWD